MLEILMPGSIWSPHPVMLKHKRITEYLTFLFLLPQRFPKSEFGT